MLRFLMGRMGGSLVAVWGATVISFVILRLLPGNPARVILGPLAPKSAVAAETHALGLDQPIYAQYLTYVRQFVHGDWGYSYSAGQSVTTLIAERLPASIELALFAFVFAFLGAVILALIVTYKRRPVLDGVIRSISFVGLGTPPFWLAVVLLLVFYSYLRVLPGPEGFLTSGTPPPPTVTHFITVDAALAGRWDTLGDALKHIVLPAFALGFAPFSYLVRLLRANLLDVAREPYIVVARSKGLSRWLAFARHALPNAFLPTLTAAGIILTQLLAGSVLVESIFNWPGVGQLIVQSILVQDFAVVQAFILLSAVAYVLVNALVDILYGVIDPRIRQAGKAA
jgi:ABC-type dipeptide/oligopeptide/nickel transport system permease component